MENLRKAQLCQLDLLIEFDRICKKNNINYQLISGTLLGAIRHKGFIPWDDDLDVGLLRDDYEKFLKVYKNDIKEEYIVDNWDENKNYGLGYAKMKIKNTHYLERDAKNVKINDGIFIDIFPFDNWYNDEDKAKKIYKKLFFWRRVYRFKKGYSRPSFIKKIGAFIIKMFGLLFTDSYIKNKIKYYCSLGDSNSDYVINNFAFGTDDRIYKSSFSTLVEGEFEGYKFPITKEYDKNLSLIYGDYMTPPPENKRENRHGIIKLDFNNYEPKNKKYKEEIKHEKK